MDAESKAGALDCASSAIEAAAIAKAIREVDVMF